MKLNHPYQKYENSKLWIAVENAIDDLIENQDIELTTRKEYVVGYICKIIYRNDILLPAFYADDQINLGNVSDVEL
jgi:hypothetical protein